MILTLLLVGAAANPDSAELRRVLTETLHDLQRPCGQLTDASSIIVCGRKGNRYQVSEPDAPFDPDGNVRSVARERSEAAEAGDTGIGSCSNVGPGGWTGCLQKQWCINRQQHGGYCTR